jgi:hypothetical protein
MLRFSLKDMFVSTTQIAIGMAMLNLILPPVRQPSYWTYLLWFGAGAYFGAGLFGPFNKPWVGVTIGLITQLLLMDLLTLGLTGA